MNFGYSESIYQKFRKTNKTKYSVLVDFLLVETGGQEFQEIKTNWSMAREIIFVETINYRNIEPTTFRMSSSNHKFN